MKNNTITLISLISIGLLTGCKKQDKGMQTLLKEIEGEYCLAINTKSNLHFEDALLRNAINKVCPENGNNGFKIIFRKDKIIIANSNTHLDQKGLITGIKKDYNYYLGTTILSYTFSINWYINSAHFSPYKKIIGNVATFGSHTFTDKQFNNYTYYSIYSYNPEFKNDENKMRFYYLLKDQ